MPHYIHLVGSVPFADTETVFRNVGEALGPHLRRVPDGETGERGDWITWLEKVFSGNPAFRKSDETFAVHAASAQRFRYGLTPGFTPKDVQFDNLYYADNAEASYRIFARLKQEGVIPAHVRFQIDLVPAHSVLWLFVQEALQKEIDPIYNDAVKREIDKIAAHLPHDQIAIQFDVASAVFARLERKDVSSYGSTKNESAETFASILVDLANHVPDDIELLFHFCYGDANHKHAVEPTDMGDMVHMANQLTTRVKRPIQLIHMPVPRNRDDDAYFAPLRDLQLTPATDLALGLVHYTDGLAGTSKRLDTARKYLSDFAVGTECGFGRRDPKTIPDLLDIHAAAATLP